MEVDRYTKIPSPLFGGPRFGLASLLIAATVAFGCGGMSVEPEGDAAPEADPDSAAAIDTPHRIVFQSERGAGIDVWVMNADGSGARNLTNNGEQAFNDRHPTASADGARIAFRSDRDGDSDVFAMEADGSNQINLTSHEAMDIDPSFSPDGSRMAFDTNRDGNVEIYVMNADGSAPVRLTDNDVVDSHPFWSPGGEDIAFYSDRDNPGGEAMDIYVMATRVSAQTRANKGFSGKAKRGLETRALST